MNERCTDEKYRLSFIKELYEQGRKALSEAETKALIRYYGIPTPPFEVMDELHEKKYRFPLVLKVNSPEILHKTEKGGVFVDIRDFFELKEKFMELKKRFPGASILIEPMEKGEVEVITGLFRDRVFGMSIMFGMGGIMAELYQDVVFRKIPISVMDAEEMMDGVMAGKLLRGYRGIKADRDAVKNLLLAVSRLGVELGDYINQLDLNPVIVKEKGCVAVDAKLILEHQD